MFDDEQFLSNHQDIAKWLDDMQIPDYIINTDLTVDIQSSVIINKRNLNLFPIQFGKVSGNFDCSNNELISLKGAPSIVGGSFYCMGNLLTSLKNIPSKIGFGLYCGGAITLDDLKEVELAEFVHQTYRTEEMIPQISHQYHKTPYNAFVAEINGLDFAEIIKSNYEKTHLNKIINKSQNIHKNVKL